ncbi:MAG: ketoacyl-ACP synthase III [Prevotellaceae bacterium]|nr:ketoacyl-ACP synthase III [Candidatus Colivivens equi]
MAFLEFKNVRIVGISAGVPKKKICNLDLKGLSKDYNAEAFVETTGVKERRVDDLTTSDLCVPAAERLIADLGWDKAEIEAIILVSQTTDYYLPATACILQNRLGLTKECYAEDIVLGCSGWVYALSNIVSLMSTGGIKKALLLAGDAKPHVETNDPLFGFAGTATALEYKEGAEGFKFHFGTDGSGYDAIIIPDGGTRNQVTEKSFDFEEIDGKQYNRLQTRMKGMDVFSFGISTAPKSIKKLAENFAFDYQDCDYFILHQANMKMNNMIAKKLKLASEKVPSSMWKFGNTSSASIPLTIVTQLKGKFENKPTRFICCGFGVGLSWGTVVFSTNDIVISQLVEVDKQTEEQWV